MLFKINTLQVVSDGAVVSEVGGYSSAEILEALGVHAEENIFSFDPAEKSAALERQFPLLENIHVERDYPNTVVLRADAATASRSGPSSTAASRSLRRRASSWNLQRIRRQRRTAPRPVRPQLPPISVSIP